MTRINSGIHPQFLTDEHLLAEHREIKRIPNTKFVSKPGKEWTLGKGHVLFFVDKPNYTYWRYRAVYSECIKRGFNVTDYSSCWKDVSQDGTMEFIPDEKVFKAIKERIIERIKTTSKPNWHYYGTLISKEDAILLIYLCDVHFF